MKTHDSLLPGLMIIEPKIFTDERGCFYEIFQHTRYHNLGIPSFVQDNVSHSKKEVIRGLHYQHPHAQGKLVGVIKGEVWDVIVDIRVSSPTFGKWVGITLSDTNKTQVYIPPGFAHGFCVLSEEAIFYYKCTDFYIPHSEHGIAWNDKQLNIPWPAKNPILSSKDKCLPSLNEVSHEKLFT